MVRAFGFCNDLFDTASPGRLCRGRERWVEPLPDAPAVTLHRTVVSGATFSDDSARDALRGFAHSGVDAGRLLAALFPGQPILAFAENGDPRALPPVMLVEEDWTRPLEGGARSTPAVRWIAPCPPADVAAWIAGERDGVAVPQAEGFVIGAHTVDEALAEAVFRLVGWSEPDDRPARRYDPTALPAVLDHARAVVLLHLDKHGPALAVYTSEPLDSDGVLDLAARAAGAFPVPFAIPPMLARWDRALYELRLDWDPDRDGEFPVPPADDAGGRWSTRRRAFEEESAAADGAEE